MWSFAMARTRSLQSSACKTRRLLARQCETVGSNQSLNRTRNGMPPSGLISFWPFGVLPSLAG